MKPPCGEKKQDVTVRRLNYSVLLRSKAFLAVANF